MEGLNRRYGVRGKYFLLLFLPFRYLLVQSEENVGRKVLCLSNTGIVDSKPTGVIHEFFVFLFPVYGFPDSCIQDSERFSAAKLRLLLNQLCACSILNKCSVACRCSVI